MSVQRTSEEINMMKEVIELWCEDIEDLKITQEEMSEQQLDLDNECRNRFLVAEDPDVKSSRKLLRARLRLEYNLKKKLKKLKRPLVNKF